MRRRRAGGFVNTASSDGHIQTIDTNVSSSYWLIGAYNPVFGNCSGNDICSHGYDNGNNKHDYVKLLALKGHLPDLPPPPGVPEPLSVLPLAGGLVPPASWRRRRLQQVAEAC